MKQTGQSSGNAIAKKAVGFNYYANGQIETAVRQVKPSSTWNEVATSTFSYDAMGRLTGLGHAHSTTTIASYGWTFDVGSRITQLSGPDGTSDFSYDNTSQLTGADHSYQTDESYSYDANGNRIGGSYGTDTNNRLSSDGTYSYDCYDAEGNRLTRTVLSGAHAGYVTLYQWDYRNRVTAVIGQDDSENELSRVEFVYDVFNQHIAKSVDADGLGGDDPLVTSTSMTVIIPSCSSTAWAT